MYERLYFSDGMQVSESGQVFMLELNYSLGPWILVLAFSLNFNYNILLMSELLYLKNMKELNYYM